MKRPLGITVLAVLCFVSVALQVLLELASFLGVPFGRWAGVLPGDRVNIVFPLLGAALQAWIGFGLWKLQYWARMLLIVVSSVGAALTAIEAVLLAAKLGLPAHVAASMGTRMALGAFIILYLMTDSVKQAFSKTEPTLW